MAKVKEKPVAMPKLESRAEVMIPQERSELTGGSGLLHTEIMRLKIGRASCRERVWSDV